MKNSNPTGCYLTKEQVHQRLLGYGAPDQTHEITKELQDLGKFLVQEKLARTGAIETKATLLLGYAVAMIGFLSLHETGWRIQGLGTLQSIFLVMALVDAFLTGGLAFCALRLKDWQWISQGIWLPRALVNDEQLRRHYIECLHEVDSAMDRVNARKTLLVDYAQWSTAWGALLLALAKLFL